MSRVRIRVTRRASGWFALVAMAAAATALSQCRMIPSSITGVDASVQGLNARSECVQGCNEDFRSARLVEMERHHDALIACGADEACKAAENTRHQVNLAALVDAMQDCKNQCYNEGSGSGGR